MKINAPAVKKLTVSMIHYRNVKMLKDVGIFQKFPELEELETHTLKLDTSFIPLLPKLRKIYVTGGSQASITSDTVKSVTFEFADQWHISHLGDLSISGKEIEDVTLLQ